MSAVGYSLPAEVLAARYGVVGDARTTQDGAITTGTPNLTSATAAFTAADVGKTVSLATAAGGGLPLVTTILTYVSATAVTLAANAGATVSGQVLAIGTNNVAALNAAMTAAGVAGASKTVKLDPGGKYLFNGRLVAPDGVSLVADVGGTPTFPLNRTTGAFLANAGAVLMPVADSGSITPTSAFLTLGSGSYIDGFSIYHPGQTKTSPPVTFPPAIYLGSGEDGGVGHVMMVNPYIGFYSTGRRRPSIEWLYGQPLFKGVFIDQATDAPQIGKIHFWPFWSDYLPLASLNGWMLNWATAVELRRVDAILADSIFAFGYNKGLHLAQALDSSSFGAYGGIANAGFDECRNAIQCDYVSPTGINIGWCDIVGYESTSKCIQFDNRLANGQLNIRSARLTCLSGNADVLINCPSTALGELVIGYGDFAGWNTAGSKPAIIWDSATATFEIGGRFRGATSGGYHFESATLTAAATNKKHFNVSDWGTGGRRFNRNASPTPVTVLTTTSV